MNQETRIEKIDAIIKQGNPCWIQKIRWKGETLPFKAYRVPLNALVYNKYNGRILTRTRSLENQGYTIDSETDEWKTTIENLLWESKKDRNEKTLKDLEVNKQLKPGIITKDWIIIDGNRRAMLLNRSKQDYFEAIILPVTLEQDPLAIQELETAYQMWEDGKLDYNPIEKYLKAADLSLAMPIERIASLMSIKESEVEDYIEIKNTMDEYLEYLGHAGIYTQLDWREDHFINLNKWVSAFGNTESNKGFDGYRKIDVDNLKYIAFDYIRIRYEGKKFRNLAEWLKDKHIFWDKTIWLSFSEKHKNFIQPIQDQEESINTNTPNLKAYLDDRDDRFANKVANFMDSNMDEHIEMIYNRRVKDEPQKLVNKATDALESIDSKKQLPEAALTKLKELEKFARKLITRDSPAFLLDNIIADLSSINVSGFSWKDRSLILEKIKEINKLTYQIEKNNK